MGARNWPISLISFINIAAFFRLWGLVRTVSRLSSPLVFLFLSSFHMLRRRLAYFLHVNKMCSIVCGACLHWQRSIFVSSTLRRNRNTRRSIFLVLICIASALRSLINPLWSFNTAFLGVDCNAYSSLPAWFLFHEVVHCCWASFARTIFLALLRWWANVAGFVVWSISYSTSLLCLFFFYLHSVACLAAMSTISLPLIPICAAT